MALGRFMDEWSKLEIALGSLLSRALKLGSGQLPALANSLGTRGILDVLSVQMTRKLPGANVELAQKLLDRVKEKNTQRNYLTHGFWILEWNIVDQGGRPAAIPRVYRGYTPTDPDVAERLKDPRNRKERLRFMFTVKRIDALSLSVGALCLDISRFANRHFNQSKPLKQDVNLPVTDNVFGTAITKPFTNSTP